MWGAIIGDLAGSIYEYNQIKKVKEIKNLKEVIPENAFYSDDTILTIATLEALLSNKDYTETYKKYGQKYKDYKPNFTPYFKTTFSPGFTKWIENPTPRFSKGNGALMKISPVAYLSTSEEQLITNTIKATKATHNTEEAISSALIITKFIYLAKKGYTKNQIIEKLNLKPSITKFQKFNTTCNETLNNCLYMAINSNSFEDSIKKIISLGGDTDTNACITGSISESLYGINKELIEKAQTKIPQEFTNILNQGYQRIKKWIKPNKKSHYTNGGKKIWKN